MSKEIDDLVQIEFDENVAKFLKKEVKSIAVKYLSLNDIEEKLNKLGFEKLDDEFDSNGWAWDFWGYMRHETFGKICISGSGFYGNIIISIASSK